MMASNDGVMESMTIKNFVLIESKRPTPISAVKIKIYPALVCLLDDSITIIDEAKKKLRANFSAEKMANCIKDPIVEVVFTIERNTQQIVIGGDDRIILEPTKECPSYNNKVELGRIVDKLNAYCDGVISRMPAVVEEVPPSPGLEFNNNIGSTSPVSIPSPSATSPAFALSPKKFSKQMSKLSIKPRQSTMPPIVPNSAENSENHPPDPNSDVKYSDSDYFFAPPSAPVEDLVVRRVHAQPNVEKVVAHEKVTNVGKPKAKEAAQRIKSHASSSVSEGEYVSGITANGQESNKLVSDSTYADSGEPGWLRRNISREDANDLMKDKPAGAFIVRKANTFAFALVCATNAKCVNFSIDYDQKTMMYQLASREEGIDNQKFSTLQEFVEFYKRQAIKYPGGFITLDDSFSF